MAVGKGSLKRLSMAAKPEKESEFAAEVVNESAVIAEDKNKEAEVQKERGSISKIVCTLPDYLL